MLFSASWSQLCSWFSFAFHLLFPQGKDDVTVHLLSMQEGGKKETQRHLRLTSKNESSLLTHSVGANSQAHKVLSANLWLFCHQRGIHLVSMHDDDFKSYHSPLVEMKVAVGFFSFLTNSVTTHRWARMAKVNVFSSEASLLRHVWPLPTHFPKRSNLPAWIRSRIGSVVQLNTSQAFELGHRSRFITSSYLLGALADSTPPSRESLV